MMKFNLGRIAAAALLVCVTAPAFAQAGEEATANIVPWSGWWWPSHGRGSASVQAPAWSGISTAWSVAWGG